MLTRRVPLVAAVAAALLAAIPLAAHTASAAPMAAPTTGGDGNCDTNQDPWCTGSGNGGGSGGGPGGGGGGSGSGCTWQGQTVPCADPDFGFYIGNGCYWKALVPPPDHAPPAGQDPTKGAWGVQSCYIAPGSTWATQANLWLENGTAGPTPAQLAREALAKIHLLGARIGMAPAPNGAGLVGAPVWMWTAVTPGTWGPLSASANAGGLTVTITAKARRIVWDMGDGHSVTCHNPGTPYSPSYGKASSPSCGYRYTEASTSPANPHGRYHVTATTYWRVDWAGGGAAGVLNPTSQSQSSVEIQELQVVTR